MSYEINKQHKQQQQTETEHTYVKSDYIELGVVMRECGSARVCIVSRIYWRVLSGGVTQPGQE